MDYPLVSIVIPIYNVEKYLRECVDSILSQDYNNTEIILVDDGSPDNCGRICDDYANSFSNVISLHKENGGLSDARNYGMKYAKGKYICFVDSDDYVSPQYISHLFDALRKTGADVSVSWFSNVYDYTPICERTNIRGLEKLSGKQCLERLLYQNGIEFSAWGKLYKRELLNGLEYPKGKLYEDILVTTEVMIRAENVAVINNEDYFYRQRKDSIQYQAFNHRKLDCVKHMDMLRNRIKQVYPDLDSAAACRQFCAINNILFQIPHHTDSDIQENLWNRVKELRGKVLFNNKAKKRIRIAAALSYLGKGLFSYVYHKTQTRG